MGKAPAFQLYAADFFMDTIGWSDVEVGIYIRLLLLEWINGPLPNDHKQLIKQLKTHHKTFNKAWLTISNKFVNNGQGLINIRLEEEREKQKQYYESQAESGKRGVETKKKKGIFPFDKSTDPSSGGSTDPSSNPPSENQALQSSSSSTTKKKEIYKESVISFDLFYEKYPRKIARDKCYKKWHGLFKRINKEKAQLLNNEIIAGLDRYIQYWIDNNTEKEFIPHSLTWLNQARWKDEILDVKDKSYCDPEEWQRRLEIATKNRKEGRE